MGILYDEYAFSFSHAIIRARDRQYVGIRSVTLNQELTEAAIYGTDMRPLKRTVGQVQLGRGQLIFSDYEEGTDFFKNLGDSPLTQTFTLEYSLQKGDGTTRSIECRGCRLLGLGVEHENSAEALEINYTFSFLEMIVDGKPSFLAQLFQAIGQALF